MCSLFHGWTLLGIDWDSSFQKREEVTVFFRGSQEEFWYWWSHLGNCPLGSGLWWLMHSFHTDFWQLSESNGFLLLLTQARFIPMTKRGERLCIPSAILLCTFLLLLIFSILENSHCRTSLAPIDHKIRSKKFKHIYFGGKTDSFSLIIYFCAQLCCIIFFFPVLIHEWYIIAFKFYFLLKVSF